LLPATTVAIAGVAIEKPGEGRHGLCHHGHIPACLIDAPAELLNMFPDPIKALVDSLCGLTHEVC
jgi:hypothetical protein